MMNEVVRGSLGQQRHSLGELHRRLSFWSFKNEKAIVQIKRCILLSIPGTCFLDYY